MTFYLYNQNNSGGHMKIDLISGITEYVIVEANSPEEADNYFESIGGYFDGVYAGVDCDCCGDRWYRAEDWNAVNPYDIKRRGFNCSDKDALVIHFLDGRVKWPLSAPPLTLKDCL